MNNMQIITNNVPRETIYWHNLAPKEQKEFDYMETPEDETFVRYRGEVYSLSDFVRIVHKATKDLCSFAHYDHSGELRAWDGILTDSFFSAVLIKFPEHDAETVIMGLALS